MNTPASSAHIPDEDIERFARRALPAAAVVPLTDHLAECAECQRRLARYCDVEGALGSFAQDWDRSSGHVAESDVHALVDGRLDPRRRNGIERHLDLCRSCRDEVRDLRASAAALRAPVSGVLPRWGYAGLAAAAMLVLALAIPSLLRTGPERTGAVPDDVPSIADGVSQNGVSQEDAERVRRTLASGRLSFPSHVQDLVGTRGVLRGDSSAPGFELVGPVGTAVADDRPTLRWTAAAPSAAYVVTLQDELTGATTSSPVLRSLEWAPASPLTRGRAYLWQVAASLDGREIVAPAPPDPAAKLFVLTAADAARAAQRPASPLVRGLLYAELGLLDEAERELASLSAPDPDAAIAEGFLRQIRSLRAPDASSPAR